MNEEKKPQDSKAGRSNIPSFQTNSPNGVNWLLAIAIDEYDPAIGKLNNCVKDVRAFMEVVTQRYHFDTKYIIPLINTDATAEGIEAAFRKLLTAIKPEDNLVIYYSGHGDYDDDIDLGYWIPADAKSRRQGLHNDFITRFLNRIPSRHTLLLCDSCFSGSLLLDEPTKVISPRYYTQPSRWAITSGARELVSDGKEHSPFAKALLRVLNQSSGDVDIVTLGSAIMEEVAANERQKPLFAPMRISGHQGGIFVFFQKQNEAQAWAATEAADTAAACYDFWQKHPDHPNAEEALWRYACKVNEVGAYNDYLFQFRRGKYYEEAKKYLHQLEDDNTWQEALRKDTLTAYWDYLDRFEGGKYVNEAHKKIKTKTFPQTPRNQAPNIIIPKEPKLETRLPYEPEMVFVQGGTFKMGDSHEVTVKDFYIGKYPVTQAQWLALMGANPSRFKGCDDCPVEKVSWSDVQVFIQKLNVQTFKNYRLPSEAEWEYAARGGNQSKGFKYAGSNDLKEVGWYDGSLIAPFISATNPVGRKKANELGVYDMSGNVWEWCADVWHDSYKGAPHDGSAWMEGGEQHKRVVRGGSWSSNTDFCRVSFRLGFHSFNTANWGNGFGFRLACTGDL